MSPLSITRKLAIALGLLIVLSFSIYVIMRWTYADDPVVNAEKKRVTDTLNIGIIGDSWVSGKKLDTIVGNALSRHHLKFRVISFGQGGASSKLIYQNLFSTPSNPFSSSAIFHSNLRYCVVIAGVNDAIGQYGAPFYTHHELAIIRSLLKDHIRPVVVTLPEFGLEETEKSFNIFKHTRNQVFGYFTGNGFNRTIPDYRRQLDVRLSEEHLQDSIVAVNFDSVIRDYAGNKRYYREPPHLNLAGNQLFGRKLVECILNDYDAGYRRTAESTTH